MTGSPPTRALPSPRRIRLGPAGAVLAAALLISGCSTELYSGLTEAEANQIVAVLMSNGLSAEKVAAGDTFTVTVDESEMLRAISLLEERGLPKQSRSSIGTVFQKSGIMSSPFEERVRYIYALGEEVAQTLSEIDGVVTARVHIVLPEEPSLGQPVKPSSASVFIKHQPGVDLDFFVPQIRRLVSSAIEGLDYASVTVVLSEGSAIETRAEAAAPLTEEVLPGLSVATAGVRTFWIYTGVVLGLLAVAMATAGALAYRMVRPKGAGSRGAGRPVDQMEPT